MKSKRAQRTTLGLLLFHVRAEEDGLSEETLKSSQSSGALQHDVGRLLPRDQRRQQDGN